MLTKISTVCILAAYLSFLVLDLLTCFHPRYLIILCGLNQRMSLFCINRIVDKTCVVVLSNLFPSRQIRVWRAVFPEAV